VTKTCWNKEEQRVTNLIVILLIVAVVINVVETRRGSISYRDSSRIKLRAATPLSELFGVYTHLRYSACYNNFCDAKHNKLQIPANCDDKCHNYAQCWMMKDAVIDVLNQ
jgi:hypothetical protein